MADPASDPQQLRRQILQGAVADNVATKEGRHVPPSPRPAGVRRRSLPMGIVVVSLVAAGAATFWWIRPRQQDDVARVPVGELALESVATTPVVVETGPAPEAKVFPAPTPIDAGVFPLAVRRIVVDPGHGGLDRGTAENGLSEKDLTLDIGLRLRDKLNEAGYEVVMTRDDDTAVSLRRRAEMANEVQADIFVSVHINWIAARRVRGVETYYLGPTDDPILTELARQENRESGYALGDLKKLLEGIYADVRQAESRQLASRIQRSLYAAHLRDNPGIRDRGVKTAPFVVLITTEMPAILAEVSTLSNHEDAALLERPLYREHIASALFRGIRGYASDVNQTEEKGS